MKHGSIIAIIICLAFVINEEWISYSFFEKIVIAPKLWAHSPYGKEIQLKSWLLFDMKDKVSIITPCYNSARFISKTIESVLNQTYPYWEMIIVDDCSHDNTKEVVEQYCKLDSRIRLLCLEKNSGSATIPRNKAIEEAEGRFIAFIDSDDLWKPEKLERQLPFLIHLI